MNTDEQDEEGLGKVYDSDLVRRLWPIGQPSLGLVVLSLVLIPLRGVLEV